MLKKIILASLVAVSTYMPAANANLKNGDLCYTYARSLDQKFECNNLFNKEPLTINEIYAKGYRVVALSNNPSYIIIEKQS